jgi:hypothetical protein
MGTRLFTLVAVAFTLAVVTLLVIVAGKEPAVAMVLQIVGAAVLGVALVSLIKWVAEG